MKFLVILRGCAGSGKSFIAQKIVDALPELTYNQDKTICSADYYFLEVDGSYNFNPSKLKQAHEFCYKCFCNAVRANYPLIVVDNTNTQFWEMEQYIVGGLAAGYNVIPLDATPSISNDELVRLCVSRNVHGVPAESITKMVKRYESNVDVVIQLIGKGLQ